jgi:hypothetical protein
MMDGALGQLVYEQPDNPLASLSEPQDDVRIAYAALALAIEPHGVTAEVEDHFFRRGLDEDALNDEATHLLWTSAETSLATVAWPIFLIAASVFAATALVLHL